MSRFAQQLAGFVYDASWGGGGGHRQGKGSNHTCMQLVTIATSFKVVERMRCGPANESHSPPDLAEWSNGKNSDTCTRFFQGYKSYPKEFSDTLISLLYQMAKQLIPVCPCLLQPLAQFRVHAAFLAVVSCKGRRRDCVKFLDG